MRSHRPAHGQSTPAEVVALSASCARTPTFTEHDVIEYCRKSLAGYKVPKHVYFRKELPKSNVGKILRKELEGSSAKRVSVSAVAELPHPRPCGCNISMDVHARSYRSYILMVSGNLAPRASSFQPVVNGPREHGTLKS